MKALYRGQMVNVIDYQRGIVEAGPFARYIVKSSELEVLVTTEESENDHDQPAPASAKSRRASRRKSVRGSDDGVSSDALESE